MITLDYDFDDDSFEYEVDPSDYFDTLDDFDTCVLGKDIYDKLSTEEKDVLLSDFGTDATSFSSQSDLCVDLSRALISDSNVDELAKDYIEQITDYFYEDAKDAYENSLAYKRDKYGYYGVSERDFY